MASILKSKLKENKKLLYIKNCISGYSRTSSYEAIPNQELRSKYLFFTLNREPQNDIVVYKIDIKGGRTGFFAIYRQILQMLYICDKLKYMPYITVTDSSYNNNDSDNAYENIFLQPNGISLQDLQGAAVIIEGTREHIINVENMTDNKEELIGGYEVKQELIEILAKIEEKYIRIRPDIEQQIEKEISDLIGSKKTIAIHYRGNAFNVGFSGHPIPLKPEDYYSYIDECIKNGYNQIFVATDDQHFLNALTDRYKGIVKFYSDTYRSSNGIDVHEQENLRENNGFLLAYEVMRDMLTLAYCDCLICGNSQVTIAARIHKCALSKKYEYIKIIDKGVFKKSDYKSIKKYWSISK